MSKDLDHKQSIIAICYQLALQESEQGAETWQEMEKEKK